MNIKEHMVTEQNDTNFIPIIDCPACGNKDFPLQVMGPFMDADNELKEIWYCLYCSYVPYDLEKETKGYVSIEFVDEFDYAVLDFEGGIGC